MGIILAILAVEFYNCFDRFKENNPANVFIVILLNTCNNLEIFDIVTIFSYLSEIMKSFIMFKSFLLCLLILF